MTYAVRYVHKISPKDSDVGPGVQLSSTDFRDRRTLGAALRERRILIKGERLREFRVEPDGKVVVFPQSSIWHSIIMTPVTG